MATGRYVGFVDSDDWIEPDFYRYMYDIIKKYGVSAVETGIIDTGDNYQKNRQSIFSQGYYVADTFDEIITPKMLYTGKFFENGVTPYLWNKLFIRDKLRKFYMNIEDGCNQMEDAASVYPYLISERSMYISKKCYYHYRIRTSSLKRNTNTEIVQKLRKNMQLIYNEISKSQEHSTLEYQFRYYLLYCYAWMAPWIFDNQRILEVFGGIEKGENVILYGAGAVGINIWNYLNGKKINIIDWVDAQYEQLGLLLPVHNPFNADYNKADKIVITVLRYSEKESIKETLMNMGVNEKKIIWIENEYLKNTDCSQLMV